MMYEDRTVAPPTANTAAQIIPPKPENIPGKVEEMYGCALRTRAVVSDLMYTLTGEEVKLREPGCPQNLMDALFLLQEVLAETHELTLKAKSFF